MGRFRWRMDGVTMQEREGALSRTLMPCARWLCAHPTYLPSVSGRDWQTGVCCCTAERCCNSRCCADCLVFSTVMACPGVWGGAITDYALDDNDNKWCCAGVLCLPCWPLLSICISCTSASDGALTTRATVRRKAGIDRQEMNCPNFGTGDDGTDCWTLTCCLPLWPACGTAQMWRELHHRGVKPYPECVTSCAHFLCANMCCASDFDWLGYTAARAQYLEAKQELEAQLSGAEIVVQVEDTAGNVSAVTTLNSFHLRNVLQELIPCAAAADSDVELSFAEMPLYSRVTNAGAKDTLEKHGVETGATLRLHGAEVTPGAFSVPTPGPLIAPDIANYQLPKGTGVCCSALWGNCWLPAV